MRAMSINAVSPGLSRRRSATSPFATKARLRPLSGRTRGGDPFRAQPDRESQEIQLGRSTLQNPRRAELPIERNHGHEYEADGSKVAELQRSSRRSGLTTASAAGSNSSA